jgi:hypothetical protein
VYYCTVFFFKNRIFSLGTGLNVRKNVLFLTFVNTIIKLSIPCKTRNTSLQLGIYHVIEQDGAGFTVKSILDTKDIKRLYHVTRASGSKQVAKFEIDGYEIGNA